MAYKVKKVSPSALAATEACPRFRPDGKDNPASLEGTMLHEVLESMVCVPRAQWSSWIRVQSLSADHSALVEEAASQLEQMITGYELPFFPGVRLRLRNGQPRKSPLRPGLYPECELERGQGQHGYIDLLVVLPDGLVKIVDYKMIRQAKDNSLQLAAYMCDVNRICPVHECFECRIIAPRLPTETVESYLWGPNDIRSYRDRIAGIELAADDSANDPSIAGKPGDQCQFCHWCGRCPYQTRAVQQVADRLDVVGNIITEGVFSGETFSRDTLMAPATPAQRGLRRAFVKMVNSACDEWVEQDKKWSAEHRDVTEIPGWKIGWRSGRATLDKGRMPEIREALMSKMAMDRDDILNVSSVDPALLREHLVSDLGYSEKEAGKKIGEVMDPFMKSGAAYTVWTQKKGSGPACSSGRASLVNANQ